MKTAIITANTKGYQDKTQSTAGKAVQRILEQEAFQTVVNATLPEDEKILSVFLNRLIDDKLVDVIFTLGSNGIKPSDIVPKVTEQVTERMLPGIAEGIRANNTASNKKFVCDCSVAGVRKNTLVINIPEDVNAAKESVKYIISELPYIVENMK